MALLITEPQRETGARTSAAFEQAPPKIRLESVGVRFTARNGAVQALSDVSLSIKPGEFVCLVGPSGCGKSTLLNVIAGLVEADTGRAFKDESLIAGAGPDRAGIFQEAALFPWLSAGVSRRGGP